MQCLAGTVLSARCVGRRFGRALSTLFGRRRRSRETPISSSCHATIPVTFRIWEDCGLCGENFDSMRLRHMHINICERMPLKIYVARIRKTRCPCTMCRVPFVNTEIGASHLRKCKRRSLLAGRTPLEGFVLDTTPEYAYVPEGYEWEWLASQSARYSDKLSLSIFVCFFYKISENRVWFVHRSCGYHRDRGDCCCVL